ncbi:MAG: putative rane protein, partial [Ramlibacter sp.]|nr:putative rane protein [Ramlibacter sp.]
MPAASIIDFIALAAIWGASFLFMRLAVVDFGFVATAFLRVTIAAAFLAPLMLWRGLGPVYRRNWWKIGLIGLLNSGIPF